MITQTTAHLKRPAWTRGILSIQQQSIGHSVLLHLVPRVFIVTLFVTAAPLAMDAGFPVLAENRIPGKIQLPRWRNSAPGWPKPKACRPARA